MPFNGYNFVKTYESEDPMRGCFESSTFKINLQSFNKLDLIEGDNIILGLSLFNDDYFQK